MVFSQKIKLRITVGSNNSTSGYIKELKARTQTDICTSVFEAVLFIIAKRQNQPQCPWDDGRDEWISKCSMYITMEYYFALKKVEILTHAIA